MLLAVVIQGFHIRQLSLADRQSFENECKTKQMSFQKHKAFTLIELLVIVGIISLLMIILLANWASSSQRKAAINSYKTSMQSVRTAIENCAVGGGIAIGDIFPGSSICGDSSVYPKLSEKCNDASELRFRVAGGINDWQMTTVSSSGGSWECGGCRLVCDVESCAVAAGTTCN